MEKQIEIFKSKDNQIELNVQFDEDTVQLAQEQMELLFQTTKQNVSLHIKNIFEEGELTDVSTVKESLTVRKKEVGKYKEKYNTTTSMSLFQLVTVSNQNEAHSFANGIALWDTAVHFKRLESRFSIVLFIHQCPSDFQLDGHCNF